MRRLWWLAIALTACGEVNKLPPDAALPDTYEHDAAVALTCAPGEMVCNNTCADPKWSELYCGNCDTSCPPTFGCASGTCLPANISCSRVLEIDPDAADGVYTNPNTGAFFYCDMANRAQYSGLSLVLWTATPPTGYTRVTAADLATPASAKAFAGLYNVNKGMPTQSSFNIANCCFKVAANTFMMLNGRWMGSYVCTATMNGIFRINQNANPVPEPLEDDYFVTNIPTEGATSDCTDATNPMMLWQKSLF